MTQASSAAGDPAPPVTEGLVATFNDRGEVHFAAMGPRFRTGDQTFRLRPFQTSATLANLLANRSGVFHLTDDPLQLARVVTGQELEQLRWSFFERRFPVLDGVCAWYAFEVHESDLTAPRAELSCRIVHQEQGRPWGGWNRAQHAVVELAILLTRVGILPHEEILQHAEHVRPWVEKTGENRSQAAWTLLWSELQRRLAANQSSG